ncbi:Ger(x)C family spore germination protein [Bacillus sp. FJAT-29937]|uniref:Ger(x)C family spore germination protein n=1 Tax=Bacillus sp. FJAT-29937 TaxID=1720553 RepID=UPI000837352C|nr:Ger(x)C family spore germination C-terminal domain-containing protein [Bacillus sp. FJAT-29937]
MKASLIKLFFPMLIIMLLSGCWDFKEIDKQDYVVALGFDKAEVEGIKVNFLITNPEVGSVQMGGQTSEPPTEIISVETKELITPESLATTIIAREISFDMIRIIMVSEELAKDNDFVRWMFNLTKLKDIRRDSYFIVTREETLKFMEINKPNLETRVHKYFENIIHRGNETGLIPFSELHSYLRVTEADADLFLGIYATTEHGEDGTKEMNNEDNIFAGQFNPSGTTNKTEFLGSAVFKEGRMIGKLTGEETRMTYLLNNIKHANDMLASFPDPFNKNYNMGLRISRQAEADIQMNLVKGNSTIRITVPLVVDVLSDQSMVNYAKQKDKREELKRQIEERLEKRLNDFVKKTQEEFKGEPFGWSLYARKQFSTLPDYQKFDWMKSYPTMDAKVTVKVKINDYGRQSKLPNIKKVRD